MASDLAHHAGMPSFGIGTSAPRSTQLDLSLYDTDKVENGYLRWYDELLRERWEMVAAVLELGVHKGASLELWRDYFPQAMIAGVDSDLSLCRYREWPRIRVHEGDQADTDFLTAVASVAAPNGFDLIIDDASHVAVPTEIAFLHLFTHHLRPGGLYVIEDWGTGYFDDWPDGRRFTPGREHHYGMVGLIKRLIDEQGSADALRGRLGAQAKRESDFARMTITPGLVAIEKKR
jgi:SAM-dependent methyltransferase